LVDLAEIQAAYYVVAAAGVIGALLTAVVGVKSYINSNKRAEEARRRELETRQAQMFMGIFQTTTTKEFLTDSEELIHIWNWKDYEDYDAKYGEINNLEGNGKLSYILSFFNGVGVLVQKGLIDSELIYDMKRIAIIDVWEKFSPIVREWRTRYSAPQIFGGYEFLYDELRRIRDMRRDSVNVGHTKKQSMV
jgi:hypothetical protein